MKLFPTSSHDSVLGASIAFSATLALGCTQSGLVRTYSAATGCPDSKVTVDQAGPNRYLASGCGDSTIYVCKSGRDCEPEPDAAPVKVAALVVAVDEGEPGASGKPARRERSKTGQVKVVVDIGLVSETHTTLHLSTEPAKSDAPLVLRLTHVDRDASLEKCELGILVNGERMEVPATRRQQKGLLTSLAIELPQKLVSEFAVAEQLTVGACDQRFTLDKDHFSKLRQFAALYQEEMAWSGDAKKGTSKMMAPVGGWRDWSVSSSRPEANTSAKELAADALFVVLKPSVYEVENLAGARKSQGSAVAVSPSELLTNCHVVEGAQKIIVRQGKHEQVATLVRSHPASDRCVLTVEGYKFAPVRGVRAYTDLKVGEALYTLGSPNGLELTLSNGLLSGLRQLEDFGDLIQTTAPISPGSSGGGLFDNRGNLVGITTMVNVDRRRMNQSLNFAIAADGFWKSVD